MKQLAFWSGLLFPLAIVSAQNTYSISGQVATLDITVSPDTMPLPGATITLSGSQIGTVRTDNNGRYSLNNLAAGGTYTVTPSRLTNSGVGTFNLATLTFNALGANQTANFFSPSNSARSELTVFRPAAHPEWIMDMNKSFAYEDTDGVTFLGLPDDQPIVLGGYNGVFRNGTWYMDNGTYYFGLPGDIAVVGNWSGIGGQKLGVFRCPPTGSGECTWVLDFDGKFGYDPNSAVYLKFGLPGDKPVVSNWGGGGTDHIGVFRNGTWVVDSNGSGAWEPSDAVFSFGLSGDIPVVGRWTDNYPNNATPRQIGIFRPGAGYWVLDSNDSKAWEPSDRVSWFGLPGDKPVLDAVGTPLNQVQQGSVTIFHTGVPWASPQYASDYYGLLVPAGTPATASVWPVWLKSTDPSTTAIQLTTLVSYIGPSCCQIQTYQDTTTIPNTPRGSWLGYPLVLAINNTIEKHIVSITATEVK